MLVNGIYWEPRYPRLITCDLLRDLFGKPQRPRLRVIADISADIEGSVECMVKATTSDEPVFVYEPATGQVRDGVAGNGPVILAVDNLPCELPVERFTVLQPVAEPLYPGSGPNRFQCVAGRRAGCLRSFSRATILYHGELTEPYRYLEKFVKD